LGPDDGHRAADIAGTTTVLSASRNGFSDGEQLITLPDAERLRGRHVLVVQTTSPPQDGRLLSLYQLVDIATSAGAATVTCCVPYLCYQRQDRRSRPGEALTARLVFSTLGAMGVRTLITVDRHSELDRLPGEVPVLNLNCAQSFANFIRTSRLRPDIVVSPDAGGTARARGVAQLLDLPYVAMRKFKQADRGTYYESVPEEIEGARVVIVEDLCSTGTTLVPLCADLRGHATEITIVVSHILTSVDTVAARLPDVSTIAYTDSCGDTRAPIRVLGPVVGAWYELLEYTEQPEGNAWPPATGPLSPSRLVS
jgi:ribose-phosphate pyrophosphokinase